MTTNRIFVYGYGNPGRQDDGLGPAIIDRLEKENVEGVALDSNYQLNIEDAVDISQSGAVIFIDASVSGKEPFEFYEIEPSGEIAFTTHSISPESVMAICEDLYNAKIPAYVLAIRGYSWNFNESMTPEAEENLDRAYSFLNERIVELLRATNNSGSTSLN